MHDERPITSEDLEYLDIPAPIDPAPHPRSLKRLAAAAASGLARPPRGDRRRLARALARAEHGTDAVVAPYRNGRETSYVVVHPGGRATLVGPTDADSAPRTIGAAALVKDTRGRSGLLLRAAERDVCVTGLGSMARICAALRRDDVSIGFVHASCEPARLFERIDALDDAIGRSLRAWLHEEEYVTELIEGVRLERTSGASRPAGVTSVVATSKRAAVLGCAPDAAVPQALPLEDARSVVLEESVTRAGTFYRLRVTGHAGDETALALADSHAAILFPILASKKDYAVQRAHSARAV